MTEENKLSLYQRMLQVVSAERISNHESDLYVPVTPETMAVKAEFPTIKPRTFWSQIDNCAYYEYPFQYEPYWERKQRGWFGHKEELVNVE